MNRARDIETDLANTCQLTLFSSVVVWWCIAMYMNLGNVRQCILYREVVGANQPYCRRSSSSSPANTKLKAGYSSDGQVWALNPQNKLERWHCLLWHMFSTGFTMSYGALNFLQNLRVMLSGIRHPESKRSSTFPDSAGEKYDQSTALGNLEDTFRVMQIQYLTFY